MIDKVLFGELYDVTNCCENENEINIFLKSNENEGVCPVCKEKSHNCHSTYVRRIQDTPLHNKTTWLHITANEFECENQSCEVKTFTEELNFARKNKVMTDALIQLILSISIYLSANTCSLILSFIGVKVSHDTINNIINKIEVVDNPDVEAIGIDDVATRKGQTYATAIYDMTDHHLLALLDGRDGETVKDWLKGHKKIKKVARDRANAYAAAITEILPECIQIADRFHLFENLIKHLKDIFYSEVPDKIFIRDNKIVDKVKKVPAELANINDETLNNFNYNNAVPIDENGNEILFDKTRHDLESKIYIEREQRRIEKKEKVIKLRQRLKDMDYIDKNSLAKEFNISMPTFLRYAKMTDEEVENLDKMKVYKTKRKTLVDDYINIIYKMLKDGISQEYIIAYVLKKGYNGSLPNLIQYVNLVAKNNNMPYKQKNIYTKYEYPSDVIVIKRYDLLKYILILNSNKKINNDIEKHIDIIVDKYPIVKEIQEIFKEFHDTIFSNEESKLDSFIENHENQIKKFCDGLKKDITAVKNAISSSISSGFVEGNNNKFKLIKRIVYGKMKLCNLFKKNYLAFMSTLDTFCIEEIVKNILDE